MLFKTKTSRNLVCLPRNAPNNLLMYADSTMLKMDNQKNWVQETISLSFSFTGNSYHDFTMTASRKIYNPSCAVVALKHSSWLPKNAIYSASSVRMTPKCQNNSYIWSIPSKIAIQKLGQQGSGCVGDG
jgi:hypothetical protein